MKNADILLLKTAKIVSFHVYFYFISEQEHLNVCTPTSAYLINNFISKNFSFFIGGHN